MILAFIRSLAFRFSIGPQYRIGSSCCGLVMRPTKRNVKQKSRSSQKKETASALRITSENDQKNTLPEVRLSFMFLLSTNFVILSLCYSSTKIKHFLDMF